MEALTCIAASNHEKEQPTRRRGGNQPPEMNVEALKRADEVQARKGRPAWRLKIEAEAAQRGQDPTAPRTRVVELVLNKGSAGYTKRPEADDVTRALRTKGEMTKAQAWAIERFLEEACLDGIESAWENGELKLADLARRARDVYGHNVAWCVPEIDTLTQRATGESAWKS